MTARYSGRWRWPPQECTHPAESRVAARQVYSGRILARSVPEYCRDCGYTFPVRPERQER